MNNVGYCIPLNIVASGVLQSIVGDFLLFLDTTCNHQFFLDLRLAKIKIKKNFFYTDVGAVKRKRVFLVAILALKTSTLMLSPVFRYQIVYRQ